MELILMRGIFLQEFAMQFQDYQRVLWLKSTQLQLDNSNKKKIRINND